MMPVTKELVPTVFKKYEMLAAKSVELKSADKLLEMDSIDLSTSDIVTKN